MKNPKSKLAFVFSAYFHAVIFAALPGFFTGRAADSATDKHVVLITIDGFPAYVFADPKTPIPRIRQLAAEGVAAEGMLVSNTSVTWPNHTSLVTGVRSIRHSVVLNGIAILRPDQPVTINARLDKRELVAVPTIFDLLHGAKFRTAAVNWPCTRGSDALDDDFPDTPEAVLHTTPRLRKELIDQSILSSDSDAAFNALSIPARDEVWVRAACHVLKARKPHLLLLHLLDSDIIHHRYGPQSLASHSSLALADANVGRILDALDQAGIREKTTIFVTADHGSATASKILQPNVVLRRAGLLEVGPSRQIARARVQVISEGGTGLVYFTNPATRADDRRKVLELFVGKEGIAEILTPDQYARFGLPSPASNPTMSDLLIVAASGYGISETATGDDYLVAADLKSDLGYHGYLSTDPKMNALFVVAGSGIQRGKKIGIIENIDVAPTIAHLLRQQLPNSDGKVLKEILQP
jgi:arylsulfatase A-like enzyme